MSRRSKACLAVMCITVTIAIAPVVGAASPPDQVVSDAVARVGADVSPTANIDGVDDPLDVDIAIINGGIEATHDDLDVAGGKNCSSGKGWSDTNGFGTMLGGLAGAIDNDFGVVGVAPGARLWAVRVDATKSSFICALDWITKRADVIDVAMSVARFDAKGPIGTCADPPKSLSGVHQAVCRVTAAGVTLVQSAGTITSDISTFEPQAFPEVITVSGFADNDGEPGALGGPLWECAPHETDDHLLERSNFGEAVDLSAPGACAPTTYPGNDYVGAAHLINQGGVQFSAAMVAGAAALAIADDPDATPAEVRDRLISLRETGPIPGDPDGFDEGRIDVSTI